MKRSLFAICFEEDFARGFRVDTRSETLEQIFFHPVIEVDTVIADMRQSGYSDEPVLIGLDCYQVLALQLEPDAHALHGHSSLNFELEESCPVDAEDMAARIINRKSGLVGVAIRNRIQPFVSSLENAGVVVRAVVPTSLMIAESMANAKKLAGHCQLLVVARRYSEVVETRDGTPERWHRSSPKDLDSLPQTNMSTIRIGFGEEGGLDDESDRASNESVDYSKWLASSTARVINSKNEEWLPDFAAEFCRDGKTHPYKSVVEFLSVGFVFMILSATAWFYIAGSQSLANVDAINQAKFELQKDALPGSSRRGRLKRMLTAEVDRLATVQKLAEMPHANVEIIKLIRELVVCAPATEDFVLSRIHVADRHLVINGTVDNVAKVQALRNSLESKSLTFVRVTEHRENSVVGFELEFKLGEKAGMAQIQRTQLRHLSSN